MKLFFTVIISLVALAPGGLVAQGRSQQQQRARPDTTIPRNMIPPAGMCRIWLDDVPAAQQPAPTDCAAAVKNRSAKGRVIFGDDYVKTKKPGDSAKSKLPIKGFTRSPLPRARPDTSGRR